MMKTMDKLVIKPVKPLASKSEEKRYGYDLQDQSFNRWYDNAHNNDENGVDQNEPEKDDVLLPKPKMRMDTLIQATTPVNFQSLCETKDVRSDDMLAYAAQLRQKLRDIKEEQYTFSFMNRKMTQQQRDVYMRKTSC